MFPIWSPDDSRMVFSSNRKGTFDLYQKAASGAGNDEVLLSSATRVHVAADWSADGRLIAFQAIDAKSRTGWDLWVFSVSDRKVTSFLSTPFAETGPQFSPDGRWMAYASDESGKQEVYVQPFPDPGGKWQVSNAGGGQPRWRRDGKEIFYIAPDKTLMAVEVTAGSGFEAGVPRPVFKTQMKSAPVTGFAYDVSPDGKRFLVNTIAGEEKSNPITVAQNWTAELKK